MTTFWIIIGIMTAGALMFVVPPLLGRGKRQDSAATRSDLNLSVYRDQMNELDSELAAGALSEEQYQSARSELEGRVLEDSSAIEVAATPPPVSARRLAVAAVVAVPILTISLYLMLGRPGALDSQNVEANPSQEVTQEQIIAMVEKLAQRLKEKPDDAQGWVMLSRSYLTLRRFSEAADAYAHAVALMPNDAQILVDYADALAVSNGRSMLGEPEKAVQQALRIDPGNIKALALMGTAAFQRKDFTGAIEWWQKLLALVPADSPIAGSINANISQAQGLSGQSISGSPATGQTQGRP